jgi:altronate dehydratase small subunit
MVAIIDGTAVTQMMAHNTTENVSIRPRCLQLHANDNVAVTLEDIAPGQVALNGNGQSVTHVANEAIARGHKVALRPMKSGDVVLKYGVAIGFATEPIAAGDWVHTHNCRSGIDERSHTLDRHTGAPTDTQYA